jgi:glycolate oxidase FAD binding subunit
MNPALHHITEQVRLATAHATPLRIVGGGSKNFYGHATSGELLDTRPLNGIVSYEPSELVVTVQAGTALAELESVLADQGQCLPFEPPHFGTQTATVGGMVAAGLSGPARASVGSVRDYVLGLQLLNGRAELLKFGGTVMKNVAGYDVSRLMVGAMGTLGLITEVSLKVLPQAPAEASLVFELDQEHALNQLNQWGALPLPLNASRWEPDGGAKSGVATGQLFVRLRGAKAAVESACELMQHQNGASRLVQTQAAQDWQSCRNLKLPFFGLGKSSDMALWRLSVAQTAPPLDLPWPQLIEWHGGLRWLWAPLDAAAQVHEAALKARGHATLFIADPACQTRISGTFNTFSALKPAVETIHHRLKAEFDPASIFNPGRMYPGM